MNKLLTYSAALLLLLLLAAPIKNSGLQSTQAAEASSPPTQQDHDKPEHPKWSYSGALGPQHWAEDYPDCGRKDQSPVDITTSQSAKLPEIEFHYRSSPLFIENNGHTIQVDFPESEASANTVTIGGEEYKLTQFHFHQPSEEELQGHSQDMVVHLVHLRGEGVYMRLAVVAVLLKAGAANSLIDTLWQHIPKEVSHEPEKIPNVNIDTTELLPKNHGYYTYMGSLTTPPCTEIVTWYILKSPTELSAEQVGTFKKYYSNNVRPVQPLDGRTIRQTQ
jgi:carbonic anhydrase